MALLHSSTALSARVHRLVAWNKAQKPLNSGRWVYGVSAATAAAIGVVTTYGALLNQMHAVTEWLVR